ncbi:MAG: MOSC domain-containing protein [Phycisphaerae bacterium]|nr:MOSC domain-containing protein [Phycisphaerae bacterium]NNF41593.1 MOSC domain-containing protein [Phycisphaerales bacterium]
MTTGRIESIHIAPATSAPTTAVERVETVAGEGIVDDRILVEARRDGVSVLPKRQLTLVEAEAVEALTRDYGIPFTAAESRRNLCTRGVAVNHLVGKTFRIGGATLRGVELCEPCGTLERLTGKKGVVKGLIHRGGLRAEILEGGIISVGDTIDVTPPA